MVQSIRLFLFIAPKGLGRVDICARRVHNSPITLYRRGEVPSPNGLGDPTPTKDHASVHPLDCLVAMKCQQNLGRVDIYGIMTVCQHFANDPGID